MKTNLWSSIFVLITLALQDGPAQSAENGSLIPLPREDRLAIEAYLGKGFVGQAIPAPMLVDTKRYLKIHNGARNYRLVSGPDAGKIEHHQPTLIEQSTDGTAWRYDTGARLILLITAKPNGDYVITSVTDKEEGVITEYSPAEPLLLQELIPGEERKMMHNLKVFDLSNPDNQTHAGSVEIDYRYVGAYKVAVPAGRFDAVLIKWTFKGKIGPATLENIKYRFFVADIGMVAAIEQMAVSAVHIYNKHKKIAMVLAEKPKP